MGFCDIDFVTENEGTGLSYPSVRPSEVRPMSAAMALSDPGIREIYGDFMSGVIRRSLLLGRRSQGFGHRWDL